MNKTLSVLVLAVAALSASAKEVVVVLSQHQNQIAAKQQFHDVVSLYTQLELGDSLRVINGEASAIAAFDIPKKTGYKHPKARLRLGARELAKLNAFIQSMTQGERTLGAMDAPLVLSQIARTYPHATDIVLVGSALYDNPRQGVNMTSQAIPSDGFITAKPTDSPFGTKGREKLLQGKRIHWLLPHPSKDSLHSEALLRFWHLYIHHQGGSVISFSHNNHAVMQLLHANAEPLPMDYQLDTSGKMVMQSIRKLVPELNLYQQPISQIPLPEHVLKTKQTLSVGIEWQGQGVDLDVFSKRNGEEALSYRNNVSEFGRHYKDVLLGHSNADDKHYETIEFHSPVDVRTLIIA